MMADHKHSDRQIKDLPCAIVTVSDTRTVDDDTSGAAIRERVEEAGHRVVGYDILPDDPALVREHVLGLCSRDDVEVVLLTGGTGISSRDNTYEAVEGVLHKRMDGFGELFRSLSYEDIGPRAMLSRAIAGVRDGKLVFCMPGSLGAVRLAMDKLIVPVLAHAAAMVHDK